MKDLTLDEKAKLITGDTYWTTYAAEGIRSIRFSDGPSGLRVQTRSGDRLGKKAANAATCFPAHSSLAASWNTELLFKVGERIGREAAYFGVDILLAPDINIKRTPLNGRNFEYFSEDAYLNGKLGGAYASGLGEAGVGACLKHFAANNREMGRMVYSSDMDERTLRELYLLGFEIAVKESSPVALMTAYNKINGVYCSENEKLLQDILRGEWGFDGIVISDWGGTHRRAAGVAAGEDIEMPPCRISPNEVKRAIDKGELKEDALNLCVERIRKVSKRQKPEYRDENVFRDNSSFTRKCAEESIVLLENDGILPLKEGTKIALFGELAERGIIQGGGSSKVRAEKSVSVKDCLFEASFARGYKKGGGYSCGLLKKALKRSRNAEVAVVLLGDPDGENEGCDRESLSLPEGQLRLLDELKKSGKKIVGVLCCGSAFDLSLIKPDALLLYGFCGQEGAYALKDILYGKINPSGKLAESFPCASPLKDFGKEAYREVYREGLLSGYRYFAEHPDEVKYPFGYGLSYTKFEYSDLKISPRGAEFKIKNTGVFGGEIAQLYIEYPENAHEPKLLLKGFKKVFLDSGEVREVFIPFDEYSFRAYDKDMGFVTVEGVYKIYIGASSADLRLSGEIQKDGVKEVKSSEIVESSPVELKRNKKGRVIANLDTPFCELKNSVGLFGRIFCKAALRMAKRDRVWRGSLEYLPLRSLAQFAGFNERGLEGLLRLFNGKPVSGIFRIITGREK